MGYKRAYKKLYFPPTLISLQKSAWMINEFIKFIKIQKYSKY